MQSVGTLANGSVGCGLSFTNFLPPMFSIDLESHILALAHAKGLLACARPEVPLDASEVQASSWWGSRLDSLISSGALTSNSVQVLAWEAIQQYPAKDFLDVFSLHGGTDEPDFPDVALPTFGSRYSELSLLGEGATARVYKAFDSILQRWVALKYLKEAHAGQQSAILTEARAQAQVEHPNICRIYEVGEDHGRPFIAMQLVEGPTLSGACVSMSLETMLQVVRDLAEGIHRAHKKGLVHLDLKLGNVLMEALEDGTWQPFLTDFGMVRSVEAPADRLCPMGTPPYSSPEQLSGCVLQVDRRSDIYSLGVMIYVLLTRSFPFEATSFQELLQVIQDHKIVPMRRRNRELPEDLEAIVSKCMAMHPIDRYDSAQALADDLQRFLDDEPVLARNYSLHHQIRAWVKRNRLRILATASGLVILAIAGSLWHSARTTSRITANRLAYAQEVQRKKDEEVQGLMVTLRKKEDEFGLIMDGYTARIQKAKNAAEAAALTREADARKAVLEQELAALRNKIQETTGRSVSPAPLVPPSGNPKPQEVAKLSVSASSPTLNNPGSIERVQQEPAFVESQKSEIAKLDATERQKFEQAQVVAQSQGIAKPALERSGPPALEASQSPNPRIRKMVVPEIPKDLLAIHAGKHIKVKILLDVFGNAQRVVLEDCPADLKSYIREAATRTAFVPTMQNGRPVKGSIEVAYHISLAGVSAR